jgi:hypothetical protein
MTPLKATRNWVNITDCDPNDPLVEKCVFKRGTNVTISLSFTPRMILLNFFLNFLNFFFQSIKQLNKSFISEETSNSLRVRVIGKVYGVSIPWRVNPDNACSYLSTCPVTKDEENTFTLSMPISPLYPSVSVGVTLSLIDNRRKQFVCIKFPAIIQS